VRGIDPGAAIRGRYRNMAEGLALVGTDSLPRAFHRLLGAAGLHLSRDPKPGDIAMIALPDGIALGSIVVATGYIVLGEMAGLSRVDLATTRRIAAWSF
jgi:hypothetical protein